MRSQPRGQESVDNDSWEGIRRRRESREAQERAARPPWQPQPQQLPGRPPRFPPDPSRPRSPPQNRPPEPQTRPSEPRGRSEIEAAIVASIRDVEDEQLARVLAASRRDDESRTGNEDEQLARALAMSRIDDGIRRGVANNNRNGSQPRPQPQPPARPRSVDSNEATTLRMIAQLQAENRPQVGDEEAANEELIRLMMEEDASRFEQ